MTPCFLLINAFKIHFGCNKIFYKFLLINIDIFMVGFIDFKPLVEWHLRFKFVIFIFIAKMGQNICSIKLYITKIFHHNWIFTLQWWSALKQEMNGFPLVLIFCPLFLCVHNFVVILLVLSKCCQFWFKELSTFFILIEP
jgi:hypothetical protein